MARGWALHRQPGSSATDPAREDVLGALDAAVRDANAQVVLERGGEFLQYGGGILEHGRDDGLRRARLDPSGPAARERVRHVFAAFFETGRVGEGDVVWEAAASAEPPAPSRWRTVHRVLIGLAAGAATVLSLLLRLRRSPGASAAAVLAWIAATLEREWAAYAVGAFVAWGALLLVPRLAANGVARREVPRSRWPWRALGTAVAACGLSLVVGVLTSFVCERGAPTCRFLFASGITFAFLATAARTSAGTRGRGVWRRRLVAALGVALSLGAALALAAP